MFKNTLPAFAAGAIFAVAVAGGGVAAFAGDHGHARTTSYAKTGAYDYYGQALDLDQNGYVDAIAAKATCPRGTQMTGGGGEDGTATGWLAANEPLEGESWLFAVWVDEDTYEDPSSLLASVVCWSPDGRHLYGSYKPVATNTIPAAALDSLRQAEARRHH